jgi:hypothetical protein
MLGKASIIGAVAAILITPTPVSSQMGGVVDPGVQVGGAVNPGATVRGAVGRGIPGPDLGTWRSPSRQVHRTHKRRAAAGPCTAEIENVTKLLASRDAGSGPTAGAHSDPADQQQVLPLWHGSGRPLRCRASRPTRSPSATASAAT